MASAHSPRVVCLAGINGMGIKNTELYERMKQLRPAIDAAHERANRTALLEHARMGRAICESRDGEVIWVQPPEIFARYGLDEFGRELPKANPKDHHVRE